VRVSLLLILTAATGALVATGLGAFGLADYDEGAGALERLFAALPRETAYFAPIVAAALVIAGFVALRVLGFLVTAVFTGIVCVVCLVFFYPQALTAIGSAIAGAFA